MHPQLPLGVRLNDNARFANFLAGPNEEVLQGVQTLASGSGERLLYCSGAAGTGKSHLLQAACAQAQEDGRQAWYVSLAQAGALTPTLFDGMEQAQLLCIDDLHAIAGQRAWEEALFHFYNRVRDAGTRLLVAGRGRPEELGLALPDLVSRLHWGVLYRLQPLDDTERLAALQRRAASRGLELPAEVGEYLLRRSVRDLPGLFDLLDKLDEAALVAQRRLTIPFVRGVLKGG